MLLDELQEVGSMAEPVHLVLAITVLVWGFWFPAVELPSEVPPGAMFWSQVVSEAMSNPAVDFPEGRSLQEHLRKAEKWVEKVRKLMPKRQDAERAEATISEVEDLAAQAKELPVTIPLAAELSQASQQLKAWHEEAKEALDSEITIERLEALVEKSDAIPVTLKEAATLAEKLNKAWNTPRLISIVMLRIPVRCSDLLTAFIHFCRLELGRREPRQPWPRAPCPSRYCRTIDLPPLHGTADLYLVSVSFQGSLTTWQCFQTGAARASQRRGKPRPPASPVPTSP